VPSPDSITSADYANLRAAGNTVALAAAQVVRRLDGQVFAFIVTGEGQLGWLNTFHLEVL